MLEYQKEINWATSGVTGKSFRVGHGHEQRWMLRAALDEWQQAAAGQARQAGWGPGVAKPPSDPQSRPGPVRPSARYVTAPPPQAGAQTACDGVDRREMDSSGHNTRILNVFRGHPVAIRPRTPDRAVFSRKPGSMHNAGYRQPLRFQRNCILKRIQQPGPHGKAMLAWR